MIVTIDGPVASGKTTVAHMVARELSWMYLYSGMLYRALAHVLVTQYQVTNEQLEKPDPALIDQILTDIEYHYDGTTGARVWYQRHDISTVLKTASVDCAASLVSADLYVRTKIVALQQRIAAGHNVIADGRDCGTVVFPQASLKLFLTAPLEVRAQRWQADQERQGNRVDFETAQAAVLERDTRDTERAHSPLVSAPDAWCLDTSHATAEELARAIVARISAWRDKDTV